MIVALSLGASGCSLKPPGHDVRFVIDTAALEKNFQEFKAVAPSEGSSPPLNPSNVIPPPRFAPPSVFFATADTNGKYTNGFSCLAINVTGSSIPARTAPARFHPNYSPKVFSSLIQVLKLDPTKTTVETKLVIPAISELVVQIWGLQTETGACPSVDGSSDVKTEVYLLAKSVYPMGPGDNVLNLSSTQSWEELTNPDNRVFVDEPRPLFYFSASSSGSDTPVTSISLSAQSTSLYLTNLLPGSATPTSITMGAVSSTTGSVISGTAPSWLACSLDTPTSAVAGRCVVAANASLAAQQTIAFQVGFSREGQSRQMIILLNFRPGTASTGTGSGTGTGSTSLATSLSLTSGGRGDLRATWTRASLSSYSQQIFLYSGAGCTSANTPTAMEAGMETMRSWSGLPGGTYSYRVLTRNLSTNLETSSACSSSVTILSAEVVLSSTWLADSPSIALVCTSSATVKITENATAPTSGSTGWRSCTAGTAFTYSLTSFTPGHRVIYGWTRSGSTVSSIPTPVSFLYDPTPPSTPTSVSPSVSGSSLVANWTVTELDPWESQLAGLYSDAGCSNQRYSSAPLPPGARTYSFNSLGAGSYYLGIRVSDGVRSSGSACAGPVDIGIVSNTLALNGLNPVLANNAPNYPVSGTCSTISTVDISISNGATAAYTVVPCTAGFFSASLYLSGLADGTLQVAVTNGGMTVTIAINKDTIPPAQAYSLSWSHGSPTTSDALTAYWNFPANGGVEMQRLQVFENASCSNTIVYSSFIASSNVKFEPFNSTNSGLSFNGRTFYFNLVTIDAAGNETVSSCSPGIAIDRTPPSVPTALSWATTGFQALWTAAYPSLAANDIQTLRLFANGSCSGTETSTWAVNPSATTSSMNVTVSSGQVYSYAIQTRDPAGNIALSACSSSYTIPAGDITPPFLAWMTLTTREGYGEVQIVFSEFVTGVEASDFQLSSSMGFSPTSVSLTGSGTTYTLTGGYEQHPGAVTIAVAAARIFDLAGNANVAFSRTLIPPLEYRIATARDSVGKSFATWAGTSLLMEPTAYYGPGFSYSISGATPSCVELPENFSSNGTISMTAGGSPCNAEAVTIGLISGSSAVATTSLTLSNSTPAPASSCTAGQSCWRGLPMPQLSDRELPISVGAAWSGSSIPVGAVIIKNLSGTSGYGSPVLVQSAFMPATVTMTSLTLEPGTRMSIFSETDSAMGPALQLTGSSSIVLQSALQSGVNVSSRLYVDAQVEAWGSVTVQNGSLLKVDGALLTLGDVAGFGSANKNSGLRGAGTLILGNGSSPSGSSGTRLISLKGNLPAHVKVMPVTTVSLTGSTWVQFLPASMSSTSTATAQPQLSIQGTVIITPSSGATTAPTLTAPGRVEVAESGGFLLSSSSDGPVLNFLQEYKRSGFVSSGSSLATIVMQSSANPVINGNSGTWSHYSAPPTSGSFPTAHSQSGAPQFTCTAAGGTYSTTTQVCSGPLAADVSSCTSAVISGTTTQLTWIGDDFEGYCSTGSLDLNPTNSLSGVLSVGGN
jgi:hypothetical protein